MVKRQRPQSDDEIQALVGESQDQFVSAWGKMASNWGIPPHLHAPRLSIHQIMTRKLFTHLRPFRMMEKCFSDR